MRERKLLANGCLESIRKRLKVGACLVDEQEEEAEEEEEEKRVCSFI